MTSRRNFLGGMALAAISPAGAVLLDRPREASAQIETKELVDAISAPAPQEIRLAMKNRINAHWAMIGEAPKVLFVNAREMTALLDAVSPHLRYVEIHAQQAGFQNLLFGGIPVVYADSQMMIPEVRIQ